MIVEQIYTNCLAHAAYYIESEGEAAVIDPLRDIDEYIQKAKDNKACIKYVLETHFHADFVSGHIDLASKTGASIIVGPTAEPNYKARISTDGTEFKLGNVTIKVLHTPGHTPESVSYLLTDENGKDYALFTGDTLFINDVGRPDLALKNELKVTDLAGILYDSIHNKILPLADDILIYPGHGCGSLCGKKLGKETYSTLGEQKKSNYALLAPDRESFISLVTDGLNTPPQYFPKNAKINRFGYMSFDEIIRRGNRALSPGVLEKLIEIMDVLVIDSRSAVEFADAHIPGSINIGLNGQFAPWVGTLIADLNHPIVIVAPEGKEKETITRLARVGYDNTLGFLQGGIAAWKTVGKLVSVISSVPVSVFAKLLESQYPPRILDVRRKSEYDEGHVMEAVNIPLDGIYDYIDLLDPNEKYHLYCAGGYRSMIAASILKASGFSNIVDVSGGMIAIKGSGEIHLNNNTLVCINA